MRLTLAFALLAASALATLATPDTPRTDALDHPLAGVIVATATGERLTPEALAARLAAADVAILGETHDNAEHHAAQAWLVAAMRPAALAFEMIGADDEAAAARVRAAGGDAAALGAALDWETSGWPDWAMYAPIFAAAPEIPVTGGAVGREALTAAMREGAAGGAQLAIGRAAALYSLDTTLAPDVAAAMTAEQVAAHCDAIPPEAAAPMVEAQRLRDAAFADAVLRARALGDDGPVALIAGAGHARTDRGAPAALRAAAPGLSVAALALVELGAAEDWRPYAGGEPPVFDYLWFTAAAERKDPCAAFLRDRQ